MKDIDSHRFIAIEYLLAFIFCGAVIGETVSLSIIVTKIGPDIIGRLYLVNATLLLLAPLIFFKFIDQINRITLLGIQLLIASALISVLLVVSLWSEQSAGIINKLIIVLYPVAYLSKSVLFLTFWTFCNDIYSIAESKKRFPVIAAWGFGGAISGVFIARILITVVSIRIIIVFWVFVYLVAWIYTKYISEKI